MYKQALSCLFFCLFGTLLTNSIIIFEGNRNSLGKSQISLPIKTFTNNFQHPSIGNSLKGKQLGEILLENEFKQTPTNKPQQAKGQVIQGSKIKNLNLNQIQRPGIKIPTHFPDEQDIVYTSDLHIFSSLGIESGSKRMAYIKSKIEGNRKMIFQHNYSKKKPYFLAENKFIIYTAEEFRQMYLTLQEPSDKNYALNQQVPMVQLKKNIRSLQVLQNNTTITVNWKTERKMTSVKFQQTCGSCYSFTPIAAIQSAYIIYKNKTLNLAEQQVVDCSTPYENYGCIGGWNANSYKYIKDFGILHESEYPYRADFGNCTIPDDSQKYWIKNFVELSDDCNQVIGALKSQPLSIAVNSEGWMYYSSGVYTDCKEGGSNHGVILAGVDEKTWLIKNSWGFTWGQNGYIRVSRDASNNACNVCRWASYPIL